jgi:hypothetical protein
MHTKILELLEAVFSLTSILKLYREDQERLGTVKYGHEVPWDSKNNCAGNPAVIYLTERLTRE